MKQIDSFCNKRTTKHLPLPISLLALLMLLLLMPAPVQAQTANTPMPLPDLLLYGNALEEGIPMSNGSLSAILPSGHSVSTPIGAVSGTGYGFVLPVPLSMYATGATTYTANSARIGERIIFRINNRIAFIKNAMGASGTYTIPAASMGSGQLLNIELAGAQFYATGDVNASGARDARDAMLAAQYGMSLVQGSEEFPPSHGQLYLPLCDIVEDGICNASDAQRILQCDVGQPGVNCPGVGGAVSAATFDGAADPDLISEFVKSAALFGSTAPTADGAVRLRKHVTQQAGSDQIIVRFTLEDGTNRFGAASTTLAYDKNLLTPIACNANPTEALDMGVCNLAYEEARIRFNGLTLDGGGDGSPLVELTFKPTNSSLSDGAVANAFSLDETAVYDGNGLPISWFMPGSDSSTSEDGQVFQTTSYIFLPLISQGGSANSVQGATINMIDTSEDVTNDYVADEGAVSEEPLGDNDVSSEIYLPTILNRGSGSNDAQDTVNGYSLTEATAPNEPPPAERSVPSSKLDADRRIYLPTIYRLGQ